MNGGLTSLEPRPLQLAVLRQGGSWRILVCGEHAGRFADQGEATRCALEIAGQTRDDGQPVEVLVQNEFGEVRTLSSASAQAVST